MADRNPQRPSFKTDVHRAKTQKWINAPSYSYEGDEWGADEDLDEYDEPAPPPPPKATGLRQRGQGSLSSSQDPATHQQSLRQAPSFERGQERHEFSTPSNRPTPSSQAQQNAPGSAYGARARASSNTNSANSSPQPRQAASNQIQTDAYSQRPTHEHSAPSRQDPRSASSQASSDYYQRRDFAPSAVPSPLASVPPPSAIARDASPARQFPPRKQSISNVQQPIQSNAPPSQQSMHSRPDRHDQSQANVQPRSDRYDAPLPAPPETSSSAGFVRPADIYKRMAAEKEKERQSMDSGRSSIDSIDQAVANSRQPHVRAPLHPVAERKSEYGMDGFPMQAPASTASIPPRISPEPPSLPDFSRFSTFGSDFIDIDATQPESEPVELPTSRFSVNPGHAAGIQHQPSHGFRSVVEHAFDENQNSPMQRSTENSDVSRSNTDSTAGISPIMSRVPSGNTSSRTTQERNNQLYAPPATIDEGRETVSSTSRPTSGDRSASRPDSSITPTTTRDSALAQIQPGYRRDQNIPDPHHIRTSTPEFAKQVQHQKSTEAEMAMTTPVSGSEAASASSIYPTSSLGYANREADLAEIVNTSPTDNVPGARIAEQTAQHASLQSHRSPPMSVPAINTDNNSKAEMSSPSLMPSSNSTPGSVSPNKGRVKDLANKYDVIGGPAIGQSPTGSVSSWSSSRKDSPPPPRETSDAMRSNTSTEDATEDQRVTPLTRSVQPASELAPPNRPHLPGEWVSYATSVDSDTIKSSRDGSDDYHDARHGFTDRDILGSSRTAQPIKDLSENPDFSPTTGQRITNAVEDPLTTLRNAGTAMAESFQQVTGIQVGNKDDDARNEHDVLSPGTRNLSSNARLRQSHLAPEAVHDLHDPPATPMKDVPIEEESDEGLAEKFPSPKPLTIKKNTEAAILEAQRTEVNKSMAPPVLNFKSLPDENDSDRLHDDIERSLSPPKSLDTSADPHEQLVHSHEHANQKLRPIVPGSTFAEPDLRPLSSERHETQSGTMLSSSSIGPVAATVSSREEPISRFSWESSAHNKTQSQSSAARDSTASIASDKTMGAQSPISESIIEEPAYDPRNLEARELQQQAIEENAMRELGLVKAPPMEPAGQAINELETPDVKVLPSVPMVDDNHKSATDFVPGAPSPATDVFPTSAETSDVPLSNQKLHSFKEILALKQSWERIGTYKDTRQQFATMPTGLDNWLAYMVEAYPEHRDFTPIRPRVNTSVGNAGQKFSPGALTASPSTVGNRNASGSKGKELLSTAGMLGGKATVGAKGLFAKGKSRFRIASSNEKARMPPPPPEPTQKPPTERRRSMDLLSNFRRRSSEPSGKHSRGVSSGGIGVYKGHKVTEVNNSAYTTPPPEQSFNRADEVLQATISQGSGDPFTGFSDTKSKGPTDMAMGTEHVNDNTSKMPVIEPKEESTVIHHQQTSGGAFPLDPASYAYPRMTSPVENRSQGMTSQRTIDPYEAVGTSPAHVPAIHSMAQILPEHDNRGSEHDANSALQAPNYRPTNMQRTDVADYAIPDGQITYMNVADPDAIPEATTGGTTPSVDEDSGIFGARGYGIWEDTAVEASKTMSPTVRRQSQGGARTILTSAARQLSAHDNSQTQLVGNARRDPSSGREHADTGGPRLLRPSDWDRAAPAAYDDFRHEAFPEGIAKQSGPDSANAIYSRNQPVNESMRMSAGEVESASAKSTPSHNLGVTTSDVVTRDAVPGTQEHTHKILEEAKRGRGLPQPEQSRSRGLLSKQATLSKNASGSSSPAPRPQSESRSKRSSLIATFFGRTDSSSDIREPSKLTKIRSRASSQTRSKSVDRDASSKKQGRPLSVPPLPRTTSWSRVYVGDRPPAMNEYTKYYTQEPILPMPQRQDMPEQRVARGRDPRGVSFQPGLQQDRSQTHQGSEHESHVQYLQSQGIFPSRPPPQNVQGVPAQSVNARPMQASNIPRDVHAREVLTPPNPAQTQLQHLPSVSSRYESRPQSYIDDYTTQTGHQHQAQQYSDFNFPAPPSQPSIDPYSQRNAPVNPQPMSYHPDERSSTPQYIPDNDSYSRGTITDWRPAPGTAISSSSIMSSPTTSLRRMSSQFPDVLPGRWPGRSHAPDPHGGAQRRVSEKVKAKGYTPLHARRESWGNM